jgi:hypothetical protein
MRARGGVRRGFDRLSDRLGGGAAPVAFSHFKYGPGTGTTAAPAGTVRALIEVWGPGGNGLTSSSVTGGAGGGYAAKFVEAAEGDEFALFVAAAGVKTASTVQHRGATVSATAGANAVNATPSVGGIGVGGDVNYQGGSGGIPNNSSTYLGQPGGGNGGVGGAPGAVANAGGGGGAGPGGGDAGGVYQEGNVVQWRNGAVPGGGASSGTSDTQVVKGGTGLIRLMFFKLP